MLASVKATRRWVETELVDLKEGVFERPPKTMEEFNLRMGRYVLLTELREQLTETEDDGQPGVKR